MECLNNENAALQKRVKKLEVKVEVLTEMNEELIQQIINAHVVESERMIILLRKLSQDFSPSS